MMDSLDLNCLRIVIMLNVVIAIVSNMWDEATNKASKVFWTYWLHLKTKAEQRMKTLGCFSVIIDCIFTALDQGLFVDEWGKRIKEDPERYSFVLSNFMVLVWMKKNMSKYSFPTGICK